MTWKREAGSSRGYVDAETGQRLSYRKYRELLERENKVKHLDPDSLAIQRRKQHRYNNLVKKATQKTILQSEIKMQEIAKFLAEGIITQSQFDIKIKNLKKRSSKSHIMQSKSFKRSIKRLKEIAPKKRPSKAEIRKVWGTYKELGLSDMTFDQFYEHYLDKFVRLGYVG